MDLALESAARGSRGITGPCAHPTPNTHTHFCCPLCCFIPKAFLFRGKVAASNSMLWFSKLHVCWKTEDDFPSVALGNVPRLCHIDSHAHPRTNSWGWRDIMLLLAISRHRPPCGMDWRWGSGEIPKLFLLLLLEGEGMLCRKRRNHDGFLQVET